MTEPGDAPALPLDALTGWLTERVPGLRPPLHAAQVGGGHSNLTFRLSDQAGRAWVLRCPPLHGVLESAHDVGREHLLLEALRATRVPVPRTVGLCEDTSVIGAPFLVTEHVDGLVVRETRQGQALGESARSRLGDALLATLEDLHELDPPELGLSAFVRRTPYLARQLRRWRGQLEQSATRPLPLAERVHAALEAACPPPSEGERLVHGDYRLDNVIVSPDGELRAVLDWELWAVGDPLADVGTMLAYWSDPGEPSLPFLEPTTGLAGFPTRGELVRGYAERTGRDLREVDYYHAFGCWKVGVIAEGVAARYRSGAMGRPTAADPFLAAADMMFERAAALLA